MLVWVDGDVVDHGGLEDGEAGGVRVASGEEIGAEAADVLF